MTDHTKAILVLSGIGIAMVGSVAIHLLGPSGIDGPKLGQGVSVGDAGHDATLSPTSHCYGWAGGSAPSGTAWFQDLVYVDADSDKAMLALTENTDAGVANPYEDRMLELQVGIMPGDAGIVEMANLVRVLANHGVHEVDRRYRCAIGSAGCLAAPAHPECEVWVDRFSDPAVPAVCRCGSGCQWSTDGTTWNAANAGEVYGRPYGKFVRSSGVGNCAPVPCGLIEGQEQALATVCR